MLGSIFGKVRVALDAFVGLSVRVLVIGVAAEPLAQVHCAMRERGKLAIMPIQIASVRVNTRFISTDFREESD